MLEGRAGDCNVHAVICDREWRPRRDNEVNAVPGRHVHADIPRPCRAVIPERAIHVLAAEFDDLGEFGPPVKLEKQPAVFVCCRMHSCLERLKDQGSSPKRVGMQSGIQRRQWVRRQVRVTYPRRTLDEHDVIVQERVARDAVSSLAGRARDMDKLRDWDHKGLNACFRPRQPQRPGSSPL